MKMSVPQSNSTQTTAMPTAVADRTRRTPEAPLIALSMRERHERFHLLRRHAVAFGEDRDRRRGEIGKHVDRHLRAPSRRRRRAAAATAPMHHPVVLDRPLNEAFHDGPSVHVAFGRQALGRRCQLDVVGAACRRRGRPASTPLVMPTRSPSRDGDLDEAPGEAFAADLHEHVRASGFHEHRGLRHDGHALRVAACRARPCRSGRSAAARPGCRPRSAAAARASSGSITPASCTWCGSQRDRVGDGRESRTRGRHARARRARRRRAPAPAARRDPSARS